ncbi:MAG TPA: hypothetical protein VGO87_08950, partial [Acidimicrobiia bacterium]
GAGADEPAGATTPAAAFATFSVFGQSQVATTWLYAVGDEDEHIGGARASVDKPENVLAVAAAFQRGTAAGYTYGATVGGGENAGAGGKGIAPEPPPGEADGQYPSSPGEQSWQGTITAAAKGPVVDGRAHAKGTALPSGEAEFTLQHLDVPGQLTVHQAATTSRGVPVEDGLVGESTAVLSGITIGGVVKIDSLVSKAYALLPATAGESKAVGRTVLDGASVNGTPVAIDDAGIRVADHGQGTAQKAQLDEQLAKALAGANIEDIRLARTSIVKGDNGKVAIDAPALVVKYRDDKLRSSNPQGFSGGGFGLGGATLSVEGQRATSDTAGGSTEQRFTPSRNEGGDGYGDVGPRPDSGVRHPGRAAWGRPGSAAGGDPGAARPQWRREVHTPAPDGRSPAGPGWLGTGDRRW